MSFLIAVAEHLDEAGLATFDETGLTGNVFINEVPADDAPDDLVTISLFPTGGARGDFNLAYDRPSFQVRTRGGRDPRPAIDKLQAIYDDLHARGDQSFGDYWLHRLEGLQSQPVTIGMDENRRHEFVINFEAEIVNPNDSNRQ